MTSKTNRTNDIAEIGGVEPKTLEALNAMIAAAKPLVPGATRAVLGEGPVGAAIAFVGEQPGDQEDRQGRPFVGPAGQLLGRAMSDAGIDRHRVYVTNAVKHFKFEQRGKRRIHQKPTKGEVDACFPWLREELKLVRPEVLVILGATAGKALLGSKFTLRESRGRPVDSDLAPHVTATIHPSAILRAPDDEARSAERRAFARDLQTAADVLNR
jgi:uracil-DNA glycosylase